MRKDGHGIVFMNTGGDVFVFGLAVFNLLPSLSWAQTSSALLGVPCLYQRTRLLLRWMNIVASDTHAPYSLMSHSDHGGLSSQDVLWPYIALFCVIFFFKWCESFCEVSRMSLPQPIKNLRRNAGLQCWVTMSASLTVTPNNRAKSRTGPGMIAQ